MKIETDRLFAIPLSKYQLELFTYEKTQFIEYFKLNNSDYEISEDLLDALESFLIPFISDTYQYYFQTLWVIINKMTNQYIGSFCFKGCPFDNEVEIGYGIDTQHRNNGYITEIINGIINFCLTIDEVNQIKAETDINNPASIKVLEKTGFVKVDTLDRESLYIYILIINKILPAT